MARGPRKSLDDKIKEKKEIIEALKTRIKSEQAELDELLKEKQDKDLIKALPLRFRFYFLYNRVQVVFKLTL